MVSASVVPGGKKRSILCTIQWIQPPVLSDVAQDYVHVETGDDRAHATSEYC